MAAFDGPVEALHALQDWMIDRPVALPDRVFDHMKQVLKERSPVVAVIRALEMLYARDRRSGDVPAALKEWAAAAAVMAENIQFHGMDALNRGSRIAKVLRAQPIAVANIPALDTAAADEIDPLPPPPLPPAPTP